MAEQIKYNSKQKQLLHQLIEVVFSGQELDKFCADYYSPVLQQLPSNSDADSKIQALVEYCAQHNQLGKLTAHIEEVKPKEYQAFVEQVQADKSEVVQPESAHIVAAVSDKGEIIANADALLSRSLAGRYRIDQILDQSGLGAVFKAYDTQLGLDIAIKVIDLNRVHLPMLRERVQQEVQLTMKLNHSGIVQFYDSGQTGSLIYIVMEFIPGYNLADAQQQIQSLKPGANLPQALQLMQQICHTVDYLHRQGVLHASTAPENIMLKSDAASESSLGQPVLINLGLLRPHREAIKEHEEIPDSKLAYTVSPELLLHHGTDIRSDVYALGVLLYDLVVGQPPFKPQTIAEATSLHVETPPPLPRSINPNIPAALEQVILKALAKNPADRYLSIREFSQALDSTVDTSNLPVPAGPTALALSDVIISAEAKPLVVTPGERVTTHFTMHKKSPAEERCQVVVQGVPDEWVSVSPVSITLVPNQDQQVALSIQPPRSPKSRAGRHPLTIQIINPDTQKQIDKFETILTVSPYIQFDSKLWPEKLASGQSIQITLKNEGNQTQSFEVQPQPNSALYFQPNHAQVSVDPGQQALVEFKVAATRKPWLSDATTQPFAVDINVEEQTVTHRGQATINAILSLKWTVGAILIVVFALLAFFVFLSNQREDTLMQAANATRSAVNAAATVEAQATQAVQAQAGATETVMWQAQDADLDGVPNGVEVTQHKTSPNNPDTDGDGLSDGKEILEFGTDPLNEDTDSDGLSDAEEVRRGWNPLSRDSDGDGVTDSFEPTPDGLPTPEPTFTPAPVVSTPEPMTIQFSSRQSFVDVISTGQWPRFKVSENEGRAIIEVTLNSPAATGTQVDYFIKDSDADIGTDYRFERGTLLFAPGESSASINVEIINDSDQEDDEVIILELSNALPPGIQIETPNADLLIVDDETPHLWWWPFN